MAKQNSKEFAPGIPAGRKIQPIRNVKTPEKWHLVVQHHPAKKRGDHLDIRVIDPETKHAHSWATIYPLPNPGDRASAVFQQPTHSENYARTFEGEIPEGYGATREGEKVRKVEDHPIEVLSANDRLIRFNAYHKQTPQEFVLTKSMKDEDKWYLLNVTKTKSTIPKHLPLNRPDYKEVKPAEINLSNSDEVMMAKHDGAHDLFVLQGGKRPRVYSHRVPKKRDVGVIEHSHKLTKLYNSITPAELKDTIVRGEVYAVDGGKPVQAELVGGMLNATVWRSREQQKETGELKSSIYDVVRYKNKDYTDKPYAEKFEALKEINRLMPQLELPETAFTPEAKKSLLSSIRDKKNPETHEGVVLWDLNKPAAPVKAKFKSENDVYVRGIFQAADKYGHPKDEAGGFTYSHEPNGPIIGRVGTGFTRQLRQEMWADQEKFTGAVAKVDALAKFKSGALGKPSFTGWHVDKNTPQFWQSLEKTAVNQNGSIIFWDALTKAASRQAK